MRLANHRALTVNRLFVRRWKDRLREKRDILRFTFDGIVMLYIGVPALLLGGRAYYGLWQEDLPDWLAQLPYSYIPAVLILFIFATGGISYYLEGADVLFLRQRPRWIRGLMLRGLVVSITAQALFSLAVFALLSPVIVRVFGMGWSDMGLLYGLLLVGKGVQMLLAQLLGIFTHGWRQLLLQSLGYFMLAVGLGLSMTFGMLDDHSIVWLSISLLGILGACLAWFRFHLRGRFTEEVREEERQKTRLVSLLLFPVVERPRALRTGTQRPWLFRRMRRLTRSRLPAARIAEALVKAFFRGRERKQYIQFMLIGVGAILLIPSPVHVIVYVALLLLMLFWLGGHRRAFFRSEWMKLVPLTDTAEYQSAATAMRLLLLPSAILFTAAFALKLIPSIWGLLGSVPAGVLIAWWLGHVYGSVGLAFERTR